MPIAVVWKGGLGISSRASSDATTVRPLSSTALPAVSMVSITAAPGAFPARIEARKRTTTNSA